MHVNVHSERVNALNVSVGCGIMVCIILHIGKEYALMQCVLTFKRSQIPFI